jgi:hypothetical protein
MRCEKISIRSQGAKPRTPAPSAGLPILARKLCRLAPDFIRLSLEEPIGGQHFGITTEPMNNGFVH